MLSNEDLVVVDVNGVRSRRRMDTWLVLRFKLDVSKLESKGFEAEQTEIPQGKQGETEFLSTLNIVHHVSPTLNATPSDGNHLGLESTFMASKERIPASRS